MEKQDTVETILVIDDTPANLNVLFEVLNEAGFNVLIAKNGERGLQRVSYAKPDLILLDVMMPDVDGFEVCRRVKQNPETRNIPVIFMSALSETVNKVKGFQLGAADYITKPFEYDEVLARVRTHLQLYKLQRELRAKQEELAEKNRQLEEQNASLSALANVLQQAKLAAEEANWAKSDLLAGMGHELRAPMQAILGYSEILEQEAQENEHPDLAEDLQRISQAGKHLLELINELLQFSRLEAGRLEAVPDIFSLREVCESLKATTMPLAAKKNNRFVLEWNGEPAYLYTDATKLRQILINLLSNACKFTQEGTVTLRIEQTREHLCFYVRDTGIGIEPEQQQRIFQAFVQSSAAITRKFGGSGLGLAISRRLVELLHGDIRVESEPGHGSLFTVCFPMSVLRLPAEEQAALAPRSPESTAGTVLLVQDEVAMSGFLQNYIESMGFRVVNVSGKDETLRLAREIQPDLITIDVMMPYVDGWSLLLHLKQDPQLREIEVLMLSVLEEDETGYSLSSVGYLFKPVDHAQFVHVLQRYAPVGDSQTPFAMVVDDDPDVCDLMARLLTRAGWHSVLAENGEIALKRLEKLRNLPHVIFSDLMMPEMNGFEFIAELRRQACYSMIPVVVLTAEQLTRDESEQLRQSVVEIFHKGEHEGERLQAHIKQAVEATLRKKTIKTEQ